MIDKKEIGKTIKKYVMAFLLEYKNYIPKNHLNHLKNILNEVENFSVFIKENTENINGYYS